MAGGWGISLVGVFVLPVGQGQVTGPGSNLGGELNSRPRFTSTVRVGVFDSGAGSALSGGGSIGGSSFIELPSSRDILIRRLSTNSHRIRRVSIREETMISALGIGDAEAAETSVSGCEGRLHSS